MPDPAPLNFAIDLGSIQDRLKALNYFLTVEDVQSAGTALNSEHDICPAAYVSIASETADPRMNIDGGGYAQEVEVSISILFAEYLARMDHETRDLVERTRKAIIRQLIAWTPEGAGRSMRYDRYLLRAMDDRAVYGEVIMRTRYRLTL